VGYTKQANIYIIAIQEEKRERRKGAARISEESVVEHVSNCMKRYETTNARSSTNSK
jgi:hypothetical protein